MQTHDSPPAGNMAGSALCASSANPVEDEFAHRIGLSAKALYAQVADLAPARAGVYWADLLASCAIAYGAFVMAVRGAPGPWVEAACLVLSAAAIYRASLFTHELVHLPRGRLPGFRIAWNVLCGIPLLVPSFLYEDHMAHHERRSYGSADDGEYRPFASAPRIEAVTSVASALLAVPVLVIRFLVLAPLGWVFPSLRRQVLSKASALVIDFRATRALPRRLPVHWALQEAACCAYCGVVLFMAVSGRISLGLLWRGYIVFTLAIFVNALRVLCAHRYRGKGLPMTFVDQILDSNNFPNGLAGLWAPLGLRYHAMHHLFPGLPYHALGEAYRRVVRALPADSAFLITRRRSFLAALRDVLGRDRTTMEPAHEG